MDQDLPATLSRTQIDRLGDRLRQGAVAAADLRLLDGYRRSFGTAYDFVVKTIREQLHLEPTGRPAKSTGALIEKLQRETIRLSQVQDIAGCRVVVDGVVEQERVLALLGSHFPQATVIDRRANPSYGYRAVHVIADISGKVVEIQVRTAVQHLWAEVSEKFADVMDPQIKYGGGDEVVRELLTDASNAVASFERAEKDVRDLEYGLELMRELAGRLPDVREDLKEKLRSFEDRVAKGRQSFISYRKGIHEFLNEAISAASSVSPEA